MDLVFGDGDGISNPFPTLPHPIDVVLYINVCRLFLRVNEQRVDFNPFIDTAMTFSENI